MRLSKVKHEKARHSIVTVNAHEVKLHQVQLTSSWFIALHSQFESVA